MDYYSSKEWLTEDMGHPGGRTSTEYLIQLGQIPAASNVLDLCCGRGDTIAVLRTHGFKVTGVDQSKAAIRIAARRFAGDRQVALCIGDGSSIPLPDTSFQSVICECSLSLFSSHLATVVREVRRLLKEGGGLLISDIYAKQYTGSILTKEMWDTLLSDMGFKLEYWVDTTESLHAFTMEYLWKHGTPFSIGNSYGYEQVHIKELGYFLGVWR